MFGMCSFLTRMEIFSPTLLYLQVQVWALGVLLISEICSILLAIKSCSLRVMEDIKEFLNKVIHSIVWLHIQAPTYCMHLFLIRIKSSCMILLMMVMRTLSVYKVSMQLEWRFDDSVTYHLITKISIVAILDECV